MKALLSGYYKGQKDAPYYVLFSARMFDGTEVYGIARYYGTRSNGIPYMEVSLVCIDDGTPDAYHKAYELFLRFIN